MRRGKLKTLLERIRHGILSTCDDAGQVNAALFGSAFMPDDETLLLAMGENRSLSNLEMHPKAVFTIFEPGSSLLTWQGARIYLDVRAITRSGPLLDEMRENVTATAGERAAGTIVAVVTFAITGARPLIDFGGESPR